MALPNPLRCGLLARPGVRGGKTEHLLEEVYALVAPIVRKLSIDLRIVRNRRGIIGRDGDSAHVAG
jgi:hypothetical protein